MQKTSRLLYDTLNTSSQKYIYVTIHRNKLRPLFSPRLFCRHTIEPVAPTQDFFLVNTHAFQSLPVTSFKKKSTPFSPPRRYRSSLIISFMRIFFLFFSPHLFFTLCILGSSCRMERSWMAFAGRCKLCTCPVAIVHRPCKRVQCVALCIRTFSWCTRQRRCCQSLVGSDRCYTPF